MDIKKKVAVAISGGVDSAAAAYILKNSGLDVFGITMKLFEGYDVNSALYVAEKLGINLFVVDFTKNFQNQIIDEFIFQYLSGKTPNPCIMCNKKIKYGLLMNEAKRLGADYFASGHYADIKYEQNDFKYHLYKAKDKRKDQSYFLYHLNQSMLRDIIFPLAIYDKKDDVRALVKEIAPLTSTKRDSFDICFTKNMDHKDFIKSFCDDIGREGNFLDMDGRVIGRHNGIYNYTIGQKRGLDIKSENPLYVVKINADTNDIILGSDFDTYKEEIKLKDVTFIDEENNKRDSFECEIKLCQWGYYIKCTVINNKDNSAEVRFDKPERAPAPGQAAVFYDGDEVLGGGIIQ